MDYNAGMKDFLRIPAIILLIAVISASGFAQDGEEAALVKVYTAASERHLGRSADRSRIISMQLDEFAESDSIDTRPGGIATAVMVDATVMTSIEELLGGRDFAIVENSVLSYAPEYGTNVYSFTWDRYGFEIAFSFEEPWPDLIAEIETVYGDNAYLYGELMRSYADNYALRIFKAEDIYNPEQERIDFIEAMISATVIGSTFQPMLGIHDGLGILNRIGLAAVMAEATGSGDYIEHRSYEYEGEKLYSFLHSVESMDGDFIDNLYNSVISITHKHAEDDRILLPEEFFRMRDGDNSDYALFYFDTLKRAGYDVRFVVIDADAAELYSTVFFREKDADLWGVIDGNGLEREKAERWQRLPALVFDASVEYFEPDIEKIIETGTVELPPPSLWSHSPY